MSTPSNTLEYSEQHSPIDNKKKDEYKLTDQSNLLPFRKVVIVFLGVALCLLVSCLDATIVATALPSISSAFNAGSIVSWVPSAYMLTSTGFQPLYGRFSDIFGRKASLVLAMAIFMVGSLAAGLSRTIIELIIFRGIAGAGGGGIVSNAQIVISDVVSLRERGKYQGIIGVVVALGFAIGPLIGGALAQKVSWRWCFWVTLPVSAVAIVVVIVVLPLKRVEGDMKSKLLAIDYMGTALTLIGCALVLLPLNWGGITFPWNSAVVLAPLFSGIAVVSIFCFWEWKGARFPIIPMYIFRESTVTGVYITMFVNGFIFYSSLFYLPQFFQLALGYSPIHSGVFLLPVLVMQTAASMISGQMIAFTGRYTLIIHSGFALSAIGSGCLSTLNVRSSIAVMVIYMLLSGTGAGLTLQTTTIAAQASVSRQDMAVVTAVRNFIRLLGGTLSLSVSATIINNALRNTMQSLALPPSIIKAIINDPTKIGSPSSMSALNISTTTAEQILTGYTHGFRTVFLLQAGLGALATVVSIIMIKHKELNRGDEDKLKAEAEKNLRSAAEGDHKDEEPEKDVEKGSMG